MHVSRRISSRLARLTLTLCALCSAACSSSSTAVDHFPDAAGASDAGPRFSFFVTSFRAMQKLSQDSAGFGGDLRYGETGPGSGLRGADKICAAIAESSMPGAASKQWRAFLSVTADENGAQVNAIDRIGDGPWYDRLGRLLAASKADLMHDRPAGADTAIAHDFPNEEGLPNQKPDLTQPSVDNHDILTGTNAKGELYGPTATCLDWTSAIGTPDTEGRPRVGHSWDRQASDAVVGGPTMMGEGPPGDGGRPIGGGPGPRPGDGGFISTRSDGGGPMVHPPDGEFGMVGNDSGQNWMSTLDEAGCAAGANLIQTGPPDIKVPTVGSGGGYGGIYCFALTP